MPRRRPIVLGIVGDSAAGQSTISRGLTRLLGAARVTHIWTDDYHKYDRIERTRFNITPLHPDCNYLDILELHLERAHYGEAMLKPVYDHRTGSLVRPEYVRPREFVIVEGLLGFHTPALRQFYDVKVFRDPPEDLRRLWKIKRDTSKRRYTAEQVLAELGRREADSVISFARNVSLRTSWFGSIRALTV
jgi:phosphoribulokinase